MGLGTDVGSRAAARSGTARCGRLFAAALIAFPMISGVFFGALSAALVLPIGGLGQAGAVGALVGGFMFAVNAAALCMVQSSARDAAPCAKSAVQRFNEVHAS